jgi:hypothetical protein
MKPRFVMMRTLLVWLLLGVAMVAQTTTTSPRQGGAPSEPTRPMAGPSHTSIPPAAPDQMPPDATVIAIQGLCPGTNAINPSSCVTNISKAQFGQLISAMNFNPQMVNNPVAVRSFAESYVQGLALAAAAEKAGVDKDPNFQELMRIIRVRTLADAYRRYLQRQYTNPPEEEIKAYYQQNSTKFDQLELDRVIIPRVNPKLSKQAQAEFANTAQALANDIRTRAVNGEDPSNLENEVYKTLGLTTPLTTDLGAKRRGGLPAALEAELFTLRAGEVSKVQSDPAAFTIYRVRTHAILPLDRVREEIAHEIFQKNLQAATLDVTGRVHADFNERYFGPRTGSHTPPAPARIPGEKPLTRTAPAATPEIPTTVVDPANRGPQKLSTPK